MFAAITNEQIYKDSFRTPHISFLRLQFKIFNVFIS